LAQDAPYVELGFVADDRPGLLAIITAALAAARLAVVGAEIHSWTDEKGRTRALDLFWVKGGSDPTTSPESVVPRVERDLMRLLDGEIRPRELVTGRRGPPRWSQGSTPAVATEVSLDDRATGHTVLEVTTRDRPGLLFALSNTLQEAGLTISLAKINTEGTRVADVFYVTDASGAKLSDPTRIEELKSRILSTIAELEAMEVSP
jgi:[protein-PII] uridylyltransferase